MKSEAEYFARVAAERRDLIPIRTVWRHKGSAGSVRLSKVVLPWNAGAIYLVLRKPFRAHKLRVAFCGVSRPAAVAIYAQVKSEMT